MGELLWFLAGMMVAFVIVAFVESRGTTYPDSKGQNMSKQAMMSVGMDQSSADAVDAEAMKAGIDPNAIWAAIQKAYEILKGPGTTWSKAVAIGMLIISLIPQIVPTPPAPGPTPPVKP